jgi:hypothetical protein
MKNILFAKFSLLLLCFFVSTAIFAQQSVVSLPYVCSFEQGDSAEIKNWVFNAGADGENCNDQWIVGNVEHNDGLQSLYISRDGGVSALYGSKKNLVVAYRVLEFNEKVSVDITFDYKLYGAENTSMLYVGLVNESVNIVSNSSDPTIAANLKNSLKYRFHQSINWQTYTIPNQTFQANRRVKLVFVWENFNTDSTIINPMAPCIDNVQITLSNCKMPSNLEMESECGAFTATWDGVSDAYEFQYRKTGNQYWTTIKTTETSIRIEEIDEGLWDMRVRGVCNVDTGQQRSAYIALNGAVCFCADNHCINYVDLKSEGVLCQVGTVAGGFSTGSDLVSEVVDFGPNNANSRHTVYWEKGQYDPRTGGRLKTIPDGELASVRLGNWMKGAEAERITYEYYVNPASDVILLMKYAIVLEKPAKTHQAPAFEFKILDQNGNPISSCVEANFTPHDEYIEWNEYTPDFRTGFDEIVWKDWSSIGVDLRNYKGQTIKVQLTTQDCELTAHCGYAYFTLGCIDASIKSTSCGEDINVELVAPDGFNYTWYHLDEYGFEHIDSYKKEMQVPSNDTATYYCRIDYLDQEGCDFTLHTEVRPRIPFADYTCEWIPNNCKNQVRFTSKSHVLTRIDGKDVPSGEKVENHYWSINGEVVSELSTFVYDVDSLGAEIDLHLSVGISDNMCMDDTTCHITIAPIYSERHVIDTTLCDGEYVSTNFGMFFSDTLVVHTEKSKWCGCDSTTVLDLKIIRQEEDTYVCDTICGNGVYVFEPTGTEIKETGKYDFRLTSSFGCDSVVVLDLVRIPQVNASIDDFVRMACADDSVLWVEYNVLEGERGPSEYSVLFDQFAKDNGFVDKDYVVDAENNRFRVDIPKNCRPNRYSATILIKDTTMLCGDISLPVEFEVYYSSSILHAKFGNLITVLNAENNGGYEFIEETYQWYKNGEILEGETKSYFYLPEGESFVAGDCYHLVVKRQDDGVELPTCEICPSAQTPVDNIYFAESPSLVSTMFTSGEKVYFENFESGIVNIYTVAGQLLSSQKVYSGNMDVFVPTEAGVYILQMITKENLSVYKIKVK